MVGLLSGVLSSTLVAVPALLRVTRDQLCVSTGAIAQSADGRLAIDSSEVRAVVSTGIARTVEARLRYLGPTKATTRLASGELRRQFGFKLRAANTCNVVYVMWHVEPDTSVAVSVKSNPGMTTHAECDAHGYRNPRPQLTSAVRGLRIGEWRVLRASLAGPNLTVSIDGGRVWQGDIGMDGLAFDGPVGLRSDNARFEFDFFQSALDGRSRTPGTRCSSQPEGTE